MMTKKRVKVSKPTRDVFTALGVKKSPMRWMSWVCVADEQDRPGVLWPTRLDARIAAGGRRVVRVEVREIGR